MWYYSFYFFIFHLSHFHFIFIISFRLTSLWLPYMTSQQNYFKLIIFFLPEIKAYKMANFVWRRIVEDYWTIGAVFFPSEVSITVTITQSPSAPWYGPWYACQFNHNLFVFLSWSNAVPSFVNNNTDMWFISSFIFPF